MSAHKGFTLVELMVVIAIIGILSTVGVIVYSTAQQNGRDSRRIQDVQEIQKAVEQYYTSNSSLPVASGTVNADSLAVLNSYFQASVVPKDPQAASYKYSGGGSCASPKYIVCGKMENCSNNKCNRTALPADGCDTVTNAGTLLYYCVGP
jgi:prepilin-type N-terminal cleavage/methylation domain-containing protein